MRRHYGNYFKGIPHVKPFRTRLVTCDSYDGVLEIVEELRRHAYRSIGLSDQLTDTQTHNQDHSDLGVPNSVSV